MRGGVLALGAWAFSAIIVTGCNVDRKNFQADGAIQVRMPWPNGEGGYSVQDVPIHSLRDVSRVSGDSARFYVSPGADDDGLSGSAPQISVHKKGNLYIPKNTFAMEALSIYAHIERLKDIDQELSISGLNQWPRSVGVRTKVEDEEGLIVDNAFYVSGLDAMIFVPYTDSALALPINAGVIAHEHFHSLFFQLTKMSGADGMSEVLSLDHAALTNDATHATAEDTSTTTQYHKALARGVNEGLADIWGWLYSKDPQFVARSISFIGDQRDLKNSRKVALQSTSSLAESASKPNWMSASYSFGNRLAQTIFNFKNSTDISASDLRLVLIATVKEFGEVLTQSQSNKSTLDSAEILRIFYKHLPDAYRSNCGILEEGLSQSEEQQTLGCT